MKRFVFSWVILIVVISLLGTGAYAKGSYSVGDTIDDFSVTLCDGSTFTLSEALATHKIVLINIWASWCGPCRSEFPYLEKAYEAYMDDVAVVCLSLEETDTNKVIANFMRKNGLSILPMGQDTVGIGDRVTQGYIPTTIIVDQNRTYVYYDCGAMTSVKQFTDLFDQYLHEKVTIRPSFLRKH